MQCLKGPIVETHYCIKMVDHIVLYEQKYERSSFQSVRVPLALPKAGKEPRKTMIHPEKMPSDIVDSMSSIIYFIIRSDPYARLQTFFISGDPYAHFLTYPIKILV